MTFWALLVIIVGALGVFSAILWAFLTYAARTNGRATRSLMHSIDEATKDLIRVTEERMTRHVSELLDRMDHRADDRHGEVGEILERMDQRAGERHRDVLEAFERMDQRAERMDQRADERHREVIQAISGLAG